MPRSGAWVWSPKLMLMSMQHLRLQSRQEVVAVQHLALPTSRLRSMRVGTPQRFGADYGLLWPSRANIISSLPVVWNSNATSCAQRSFVECNFMFLTLRMCQQALGNKTSNLYIVNSNTFSTREEVRAQYTQSLTVSAWASAQQHCRKPTCKNKRLASTAHMRESAAQRP